MSRGSPARPRGRWGSTEPRRPASRRPATFERARAAGAEILQEPTEQPWGVRDGALRDPSGNLVRIDQTPPA